MEWLGQKAGFEAITTLASQHNPFLFVISYDKNKIFAQPLKHLDNDIYYKVDTHHNTPHTSITPQHFTYQFHKTPLSFQSYKKAFEHVIEEIRSGNTYLLNLTFKTPIETNLTLQEIFTHADAKFKLYFKDKFICFSPECFVEIHNNTIATYPMKGTIDANIPHAKEKILSNEKEMAEHVMIVDLMRNDLGMVGSHVKVEKFRYIDKIKAGTKALLQVSSKVTATLPPHWHTKLGEILDILLPAGSITGTPKKSTMQIIDSVESSQRAFYTGIFGIYDGKNLNSSVMIRFIEKEQEKLYYKSGGGVTLHSNAQLEYEELIDKVYLPI
jgi:para-aminobenzoate synthetase component 1